MRFNAIYRSVLKEYYLPQDIFHYPDVIDEPATQHLLLRQGKVKPVLNDMVKQQILTDIQGINSVDIFNPRRVQDYVIVGDCLKPYFNAKKNVDIDVVVYYDPRDLHEMLRYRLDRALALVNNRVVAGTKRKIQYHLRHTPIDTSNYSAVYHPYTNNWLKEPDFNINL